MKKLTSKEIRGMWLNFWEAKGHEIVPSKSLIPKNDNSLLWINSGVATLKDYFSGEKKPNNPRITNTQKSIRTNDIENVGVTARHHTMFEMLGNFSIGDYFKNEVISWAYELIFDIFKFDISKIYITYFKEDKETYDKWISLGISPEHLILGDKKTNFWDIGQGPCGPDTEIFYDRGSKFDPENIGIKLLKDDLENDRYIEIWNIVFSQFNNNGKENYTELKQKNIDTGAGLERIVSIIQEAPTNYDTDLFLPIINKVEELTGKKYDINNYFVKDKNQESLNKNFRIIADHSRAVVHAIQDGAKPSNTSRGYIIRRLLRRAYRSFMQLNDGVKISLTKLTNIIAEILDVFPVDVKEVNKIILIEEESFDKTIKQGETLLNKTINLKKKEFDFGVAFKLFETYGFPIELTQEILKEKGVYLDISKFRDYQKKHAEASRGNTVNKGMKSQIQVIQEITKLRSKFIGYEVLSKNSNIIFSKSENNKVYTLVESTPFYPTGGGQEKDKGTINGIDIIDVFKDKYGNIWHVTSSSIEDSVAKLEVDKNIRLMKERNHSATHLLGLSLRNIFGNSVVQLGSYNDEHKLRFDFPLEKKPENKEIEKIENMVNTFIEKNHSRKYIETTYEEAVKNGAILLEDEEYTENVRVVDFGVSKEFCGGTHVVSTNKIEKFKIIKIESKGSGIFRLEAITSNYEIDKYNFNLKEKLLIELKDLISKNKDLDKKYSLVFDENIKDIEKSISKAKIDNKKLKKNNQNLEIDLSNIKLVNENDIYIYKNLNKEGHEVKPLALALREKFPEALIIIGAKSQNKQLIAIASNKYNCKEEMTKRYPSIRGGGSFNFAMGSINE